MLALVSFPDPALAGIGPWARAPGTGIMVACTLQAYRPAGYPSC